LTVLALATAGCGQQSEVLNPVWTSALVPRINENVNILLAGVDDINSDGYAEPYAVTVGWDSSSNLPQKNHITAFNRNGSKVVNYGVDGKIRYGLVYDINNDKNMEFIISSGDVLNKIQRGTVRIIGSDGKLIISFDSTSIMYDLFVADLFKNHYYGIIGGSEGKVFVFGRNGESAWTYPATGSGLLNKTVKSVYAYDIDDNGYEEVIAGSYQLYYIDGNGNLMGQIDVEPDEQMANKGIRDIQVGKVTDSPYPTVIAVTDTNLIKAVIVEKKHMSNSVNNLDLAVAWTLKLGCTINKITLKNLDPDSMDEILVACSDNKIYALDNNGGTIWSYPLEAEPTDFVIKDADGDNIEDMIVGTATGTLYVLDLSGKFKWAYDTGPSISKVAAGDVDGDKVNEIFVVSSEKNGTLYTLNKTHLIEKNAAMQFSLGQNEYLKSNFLSALNYFKQARTLYTQAKDEKGVSDCDAITKRIESESLEYQQNEAATFYNKAQEALYAGNLESARTLVDKAAEVYNKLGMNSEVVKCELLRLQIDRAASNTVSTEAPQPANVTTTTLPVQGGGINPIIYAVVAVFVLLIAYGGYLKKKGGKPGTGGAFGPEKDFWEKDMLELEKEVTDAPGGGTKK
jgi:hypothetical protein